jgi:hypothetical protein
LTLWRSHSGIIRTFLFSVLRIVRECSGSTLQPAHESLLTGVFLFRVLLCTPANEAFNRREDGGTKNCAQ